VEQIHFKSSQLNKAKCKHPRAYYESIYPKNTVNVAHLFLTSLSKEGFMMAEIRIWNSFLKSLK